VGENSIFTQNSVSIETSPEFIAGEHKKIKNKFFLIKNKN
jgi:hypothetical protein